MRTFFKRILKHAFFNIAPLSPLFQPYKQIFPDNRWDEKKKSDKESKGCEKPHPVTICICTPLKSKKEEKDNKKEEKKDEKKEEKGVLSSTAMKVNRLLLFLLVNFKI